ncbi:MAG TPA: LysR family transcriptional regulator [Roseiarcus sp.]|nr:LysR family transcriptional regulator [Roseiarcus sp.]
MDRLASITAFLRVAEIGSFTAAARRLNLSTTRVSEQVQALEHALGVRLLYRTTRRVSLTEVGHEYYERCSQAVLDLDEADRFAGALQATPRGRLRVYCPNSLDPFIAPVVRDFLQQNAEVSIDLRTGGLPLIDLVEEGFDLAISYVSPPDSTLVRRQLATWHFVLCCAPAYLENHPAPQNPSDLARHNCLLHAHSIFGHEWPFIDGAGNTVTVRVSGNLVTTSIETLRAVTLAGGGIWLARPPMTLAREVGLDLLASGALVSLLRDYSTPELEVVALYPHRRYMSAKVRTFIDTIVDRFAEERPAA